MPEADPSPFRMTRCPGSCSSALTCSSTYSHVGFASCIHGFSNRVDEVTTNAKIAHFHLPLRIDQHVRGLYICKKEHIPQSLSRMGGCAKPKQAKELPSSRGHQRCPGKALGSAHARNPLAADTASSGDSPMACHMFCKWPFTCRLLSLIWGSRRYPCKQSSYPTAYPMAIPHVRRGAAHRG